MAFSRLLVLYCLVACNFLHKARCDQDLMGPSSGIEFDQDAAGIWDQKIIYSDERLKENIQPVDVNELLNILKEVRLKQFDYLFELAEMDIMALVEKAKSLGLFSPLFPPKEQKAS